MNPRLLFLYFILAISFSIISSCSTTNGLPDGEILYTGISRIDYTDKPQKKKQIKKDSVGVIVAFAETAKKVENIFKNGSFESEEEQKEENIYIVDKKIASNNFTLASEEVNGVLEITPNNPLMGSAYHRSPLAIGLWAYNKYVNKADKFSKWMYKSFATEPVLISTVNPETRVKVATNALKNFGYFQGKVKYQLEPYGKGKKAKISYSVNTGQPYLLDSIEYMNYSTQADSLIKASRNMSYLRAGEPFRVSNLTNEQGRLEQIFRNNGYYFYQSTSSTFKADTINKPYHVQLRMMPRSKLSERLNHPWYIGKTYISMQRTEGETIDQELGIRSVDFLYAGKKLPVRPIVWFRNIVHRPRQVYRLNDQLATQENLGALGIFSQYNVSYRMRDTTSTCDTLDMYINAVLDKPYTTSLEMNVTSKNSDRIGPGMSFSLARKNLFRGAETLNWKLYGNYEWRTQSDKDNSNSFLNSYEVGSSLSMDFPHIVFPGISRRTFRFPTNTSFSISSELLNRAQYYKLLSFNLKVAYSWNKKSTTRHEFVPLSLTYDKLISSSSEFDSIMQENPALYVSMRNRLVPAIQYNFVYQSASKHRNPLWLQLSVKEAGNLTSAILAAGGKKFNEENKELFGNPFAQYVKVSAELHNNFKIDRNQKIATRLMAGILYSYGNSTIAPYADQFYVGGANSIRAYTARGVGPGHYHERNSKYSYLDQTGDIKLEANVEYRFSIFGGLHGALFLDAGNVWLMRNDEKRIGGKFDPSCFLKDIAIGTGVGLRYDMDFLVIRLDWGVGLHDPAHQEKKGFFNFNSFKEANALHFAIGYPF